MSTRTVRLDSEAERALQEIRTSTGLSITEALKRGLGALQREIRGANASAAWEIYDALDLGPGGYAVAPSDAGREAVRRAIEKKAKR